MRRQLRDRPAVRSSLMTAMGRADVGRGLPEPARILLMDAVETRRKLTGDSARSTTEPLSALAAATFLAGKYEEAEKLYRVALSASRRLAPAGDSLVADNLNGLANALTELGSDGEAEKNYRDTRKPNG